MRGGEGRRFGYRNGVIGSENEFVFAGERATRGNSGSQDLVWPAVDFKHIAGATINLLANDRTETHRARTLKRCLRQSDRFWPKRRQGRTIDSRSFPLQRSPLHDAMVAFRS